MKEEIDLYFYFRVDDLILKYLCSLKRISYLKRISFVTSVKN